MDALSRAPLLPLTVKQRGMIGESRVREALAAQLRGRGMAEPTPPAEIARQSFCTWSPKSYKTANLSSAEYAAAAVKDVHASTLSFGNHVCRADVCHKGRLGRLGFCRMLYWNWCAVQKNEKKNTEHRDSINATDKESNLSGAKFVAKRKHGLSLQSRWSGQGFPPVHDAPPQIGSPALETNHPLHFKLTPSISMGPRCNHDLGVLLKLPVFRRAVKKELPPGAAVFGDEDSMSYS